MLAILSMLSVNKLQWVGTEALRQYSLLFFELAPTNIGRVEQTNASEVTLWVEYWVPNVGTSDLINVLQSSAAPAEWGDFRNRRLS